jgi:hypothetical protein
MQKAAAHSEQIQSQSAARQAGAFAVAAPEAEQGLQLEAMADDSPQMVAQRKLVNRIDSSPVMTAQLKRSESIQSSPLSLVQQNKMAHHLAPIQRLEDEEEPLQAKSEVIQAKTQNIKLLPDSIVSHQLIGSSTTEKINALVAKYNVIDSQDNDYKKQNNILIELVKLSGEWKSKYSGGANQKRDKMPYIEALSEAVETEILSIGKQAGPNQLESGWFLGKSTPTLKGKAKKDTATKVGDVASIGQGLASVASAGGKVAKLAGETGSAIDVLGSIGEIAGYVSIGLAVFGIAENAVRARDAQIRLAVFTKAYLELEKKKDPIATYLKAAAKQQTWEKNRRWVRVAVTSVILALSIAALVVGAATTGGLILAAIGAVLAIGKAIETIINIFRKRSALAAQEEQARNILQGLLGDESTASAVRTMIDGLGLKAITAEDVRAKNKRYKETVEMLAPHLARADEAAKKEIEERSEQVVEQTNTNADDVIAQLPPEEAQE